MKKSGIYLGSYKLVVIDAAGIVQRFTAASETHDEFHSLHAVRCKT